MDDDKWLGTWDDRTHFNVPTGQWPWEIFKAVELVKAQHPIRIVEIGCLYGGTLKLWIDCLVDLPQSIVVGIDPEVQKVEQYLHDRRLTLIKAYSKDAKAINEVEKLSPIDVLFIDGDHSYEGVKGDFLVYGEFVKKGGLIILHDIVTFRPEVGVPRFWQEINLGWYGNYQTEEIVGKHTEEIPGGGIGVIYK